MNDALEVIQNKILNQPGTREVLKHADFRLNLRRKDAFYVVKKNGLNEFAGVHVKKGLFGWNVALLLNFNGIHFDKNEKDPVTSSVIRIDRSNVLILCRYRLDSIARLALNGHDFVTFELVEYNQAMGFILESRKSKKMIEATNAQGETLFTHAVVEPEIKLMKERDNPTTPPDNL